MADQLLFEQSNESQITTEPFINRQVVYVIDQNNGTYNGQVQLDTSSLSNSGKYASYSEAYFEVPLVLRLTMGTGAAGVAGFTGLAAAFSAGLKNGYYQLIHSLSVEYNNTSVVQLTPYTNFYVNYKLMTSLSEEDILKFGDSIGFNPDGSLSVDFGSQAAADPDGHGILNNKNVPVNPANVGLWETVVAAEPNSGFFNRQKQTAFYPAGTTTSAFINPTQAGTIGKNYYDLNGAGTNDKFWYVLATIRLKDVADFFDKMPLVKGAYLRFIINTNTSTHTLALTTAGGALTDMASTTNIITGGTTPIMVASPKDNNGFATYKAAAIAAGNATYNITVASSIGKDTTANKSHPTLQQVRLYVPLYTMNPSMEEQYLSLNRTKKIVYRDIYQYQVEVSLSGGQGTFNALLTNGIPNPKAIIIIPFYGAASNNASNGGNPVAPYTSPFTSEPGTTSPYVQLTNFNVQVAGVNVFTQNELYDFEQFRNELASINAINGGLVDGLTSGLVSFERFQSNYRYYVADLSRRLPAEDKVPKSIQILGTVQSQAQNAAALAGAGTIQLMCFIEFEKEITVDLMTGAKLS